ncbi:DUF6731 family protein [Ferruginibacter yonginensis]|uniref:DUF6731 family protein n=1 Tax=Ferruginibacter yonginensis TaxID=1310416 RepID=A0ABV8QR95_9BACT
MAKKKDVNVNLFRIESNNKDFEKTDFGDQLMSANINSRIILPDGSVKQLRKFEKRGNYIYGSMIHNQMINLPPAFNENDNSVEDLDLKDTQGLAYISNFMFDPELQMLAYESNSKGVSIGSFLNFCEKNFNIPSLVANVVINPDDFEKVLKFSVIRTLQVKIARIENGSFFKSKKKSLAEISKIADETDSNLMDIKLSVGQSRTESLNVRKVLSMISEFLSFKENKEVSKILVSGKETYDGLTQVVDLIDSRVKFKFEIEIARYQGLTQVSEIHSKIKDEYEKKKLILKKFYSKKS